MDRRGFTILEIVITITIMGILMLVGVVSLNSSLVSSRDDKRKSDVETIAVQLENYYDSGNDNNATIGQYPSLDPTNTFTDGNLTTNTNEIKMLRNLDVSVLVTPGSATTTLSSILPATNATQTTVGILPQPTILTYVYQPIANDGTLCSTLASQNCRKFNLYYMTEADNIVHMVTSRHQ